MINFSSVILQGKSLHGDPAAALLEVLDPEQNNSFTDQYPFCLLNTLLIIKAQLHVSKTHVQQTLG